MADSTSLQRTLRRMTNVVDKDETSNRQRGLLEQVFQLLGFP